MAADSIVRAGQPSRTALRVATLRAVHALLDEPIVLDDPVALRILGPAAEAALHDDPFPHNDPLPRGLRAGLVVRSRLAEDELADAVASGIRQYVVLGAGLDTFAYRNPHADLRVFELDHPGTQAWKRQMLADAGIPVPPNLTFAPVDFEQTGLAQGLADAGFDAAQPACFSWLGVSMYLTDAAIMGTLRLIAGLPAGSRIAFDFRLSPALQNPVERAVGKLVAQRVAAEGEPFLSDFDPDELRARVQALGFGQVDLYSPDSLNRRYLHRRKDALRANCWMLTARI